MKAFRSLQPEELPDSFDATVFGAEPVVEIEEKPNEIVIHYNFAGFFVSDDVRDVKGSKVPFTQVNIDAAGFLAESGLPLLPSFGRYVQIPAHHNVKAVVKKGNPVEFEDILILPAQERLVDDPTVEPKFEYNERFYAKDQLYPKELVRVTGPMMLDDYYALLVHVTPFQYNPARRLLLGYGTITVTLKLVPQSDADTIPIPDPEISREVYGNLILNPSRENLYRIIERPVVTHLPFFLVGPQLMIIHEPSYVVEAKRLAEWKEMRGITTEVVSIADIGNSVAKIKSFIRNWRSKHIGLRYVLLFGDVDMVASEKIVGGVFGDNVTDYYYSTKSDPTSPTDLVMPWLSIGRIPVRTVAEADEVVDQIIDYEGHPPNESAYYKRMMFAAFFQDYNGDGRADRGYVKTMEGIRSKMLPMGFDVERVYVKTPGAPVPAEYVDGSPVPADVVASFMSSTDATDKIVGAFSDGQLLVGHRDHGSTDGWYEPPFKMGDIDAVTGEAPTVIFSVNCLTGYFDLIAPTECFAEKLLRRDGTAPSLIAATRSSHTWLNDDLMKALFDATWGGVLPSFPGGSASYPVRYNRLGDILNYAKAYLPIASSGSADCIKDHFEIYHIVGDPTLELWRESPNKIALEAFTLGRYLHIKFDRVPKDAILSIYAGPRLIRRLHPASTYVRLALPWEVLGPVGVPLTRSMLRVCFWAPGFRFRELEPEVRRPIVPIGVDTPELLAEKKKVGKEVVKGKKVAV